MTLTLELTPEQETKLNDRARAAGVEPAAFIISLLDAAAEETTGERLRKMDEGRTPPATNAQRLRIAEAEAQPGRAVAEQCSM